MRIRVRTDVGARPTRPRCSQRHGAFSGIRCSALRGSRSKPRARRTAIDVLALALWIGAGVAALAGAVAIGIVLAREVWAASVDQDTLRELGCTRPERIAVAASSAFLVAGGGAVLAVLGAVAASPLFPLGVARRADPSVGVHADWGVLALGAAVVAAFVLAIALLAAYRATRPPPVAIREGWAFTKIDGCRTSGCGRSRSVGHERGAPRSSPATRGPRCRSVRPIWERSSVSSV